MVGQLEENDLELFASGLSDPDLSLAASVHLFAAAGLTRPAALNGPQYIEGRGTTDKRFRAERNSIRVPSAPGLGIELGAGAQRALTMAAAQA
ncbi:MAG TPA: hypothetical protein VN929_05890 [Burkholderiales bacterium]|nr:hypothetical protein [Burkholderiales bacterium]